MLAQFFALGALVFWIDAFRTKRMFPVTVAVLLSGLLTFTKFEFLAVGVPVVLLLLIVWFLNRPGRPLAYFLVGFAYAAAVAGSLVFLNNFSRTYYTLLRTAFGSKLAVLETACLFLAAVMLSLPLLERLHPAQALLNKLSQFQVRQRIAVAFVLVFFFVVLYGYFVRPVLPLPGDLEMIPRRAMVVTLGNQFNLQRIGMLLSPLGLLLALAAVRP